MFANVFWKVAGLRGRAIVTGVLGVVVLRRFARQATASVCSSVIFMGLACLHSGSQPLSGFRGICCQAVLKGT